MNESEYAPIAFDALQHSAEHILRNYYETAIHITGAELLTDPDRRNRIWRCALAATNAHIPVTVIVKQAARSGDEADSTDDNVTQRLAGDWAGAQFLSQVCHELHGPRFIGGDLEAAFIILEDLGEHHSLVQPLLSGDQSTATRALMAFVRRLGRMHAESMGHEEEFNAIQRAVKHGTGFPGASFHGSDLVNQNVDAAIGQMQHFLNAVGMNLPREVHSEIHSVYASVYAPGPFRTFIHTDPCPDNVFYDGSTLRLIDFEFSRFGHALCDGLYCRVPFPTCWCSNRVPPDVVARTEQAYRSELAKACPAALDDNLFYAEVVAVTAFWVCESLRWLKWTLQQDHEWGIAGGRPRILSRLAAFVDAADTYNQLPVLQTTYQRLLATLTQRWPEVQPLPVYPAFRT